MKALLLRSETRAISGRMAEKFPPLSFHAQKSLKAFKATGQAKVSRHWLSGFFRRHPQLRETTTRTIAPQRAMASTTTTRDFLFKTRIKLATELGMLCYFNC